MKKDTVPKDKWTFLRLVIVPSMFIAAMIKKPAAQWGALGLLLLWIGVQIVLTLKKYHPRKSSEQDSVGVDEGADEKDGAEDLSQTERFLIRQINHRITEKLKQVYPEVSWLWVRRPTLEELEAGGDWRIQLNHTEPYNFGEVSVRKSGSMKITLILVAPLRQAENKTDSPESAEPEDLTPNEELDRTDALTWYQEYGGDLLATMIDDLNAQGHKNLTLNDEGEVLVVSGQKKLAVDKLEWFLPRIAWPEFCTLLKEDGVSAAETPEGLVLNW